MTNNSAISFKISENASILNQQQEEIDLGNWENFRKTLRAFQTVINTNLTALVAEECIIEDACAEDLEESDEEETSPKREHSPPTEISNKMRKT